MEKPVVDSCQIDNIVEIYKDGVTCAQLSPVTGSLLAAGSRDREVGLWCIESCSCLQTLDGHLSSVESVCFSSDESEVSAGSMSGSIKVWDLNSGKVGTSFSGHRGKVTCIGHSSMNAAIWASGSLDNSAKIWDVRTSAQAIYSFKEHSRKVTRVLFSPDGRWLVSASDDCSVKLWDVKSGRRFANFTLHSGSVLDVQFHPNEYLLASGSSDRTVRFWDLESLECVSQSDSDFGIVRSVTFAPDGNCLYCVSTVGLRSLGWEPACTFRQLPMDFLSNVWQEVKACGYATLLDAMAAICFEPNGCGVTVCLVGAAKLKPCRKEDAFDDALSSSTGMMKHFQSESSLLISQNRPNALNSGSEREIPRCGSFKLNRSAKAPVASTDLVPSNYCTLPGRLAKKTKDRGQQVGARSLETTTNSTEGSEVDSELPTPDALFSPIYFNSSDVKADEYSDAFQPKHCLERSPVSSPVPFYVSARNGGAKGLPPKSAALSRAERGQASSSNSGSKAKGSMIPVSGRPDSASIVSCSTKPSRSDTSGKAASALDGRLPDHRQTAAVSPQTVRSSKIVKRPAAVAAPTKKVVHEVTPLIQILPPRRSPSSVAAVTTGLSQCDVSQMDPAENVLDFPTAKDSFVAPDDFLPHNINVGAGRPPAAMRFAALTEQDCLRTIESSAVSMSAVLQHREKSLEMVRNFWRTQGLKQALDVAIQTNDLAVLVDLLNVLNLKSHLWNLDACVLVLPQLKRLLESKYDVYVNTAVNSLRLVLRGFTEVIKSGIARIPTLGVDISGEERNLKCKECYSALISIRDLVIEKQKTVSDGSRNAQAFKEVELMMRTLN